MTRRLLIALLFALPVTASPHDWVFYPPRIPTIADPQTNTFCASNLSCTVTGSWTYTGSQQTFSITPGIFTNTQQNNFTTVNQNGINFATEYSATEGAVATQAFASGILIPSSSTVHEADGVFGVAQNNSTSTNAAGGRFQSRALANNTNNWGAVIVVSDDGARTTGIAPIGMELDTGIQSPLTAYSGAFGYTAVRAGQTVGTIGGSTAFLAGGNTPGNTGTNTCANALVGCWDKGFATSDNRINTAAFVSGSSCLVTGTNSCGSQGLQFLGVNSGVRTTAIVTSSASGSLLFTPAAGAISLFASGTALQIGAGGGLTNSGGGGTVAVLGVAQTFTAAQTFGAGSSINFTSLLDSPTAPTITAAGCGGGAASVAVSNGTAAFKINVGTTPGSACTFTMPTATTGWNVSCTDITTNSTSVFLQKQTGAESTTSVTITNFNDVAVATAFVASDILKCTAGAD